MHLKVEKCSGGKDSKIRLTGLAAANMCGEKFRCLLKGNQTNFVALRKLKALHVDTVRKTKSWMDSELFD